MTEVHDPKAVFSAALEQGYTIQMTPAGHKAYIPPHGDGALLSSAGTQSWMPNAIRNLNTWQLPLFPSIHSDSLIEIFTAQDADSGSNPTTYCGDAPIAGNLRVAQIKRIFGYWYKGTNSMSLPLAMLRKNTADIERRPTNGFNFDDPLMPDIFARRPDAINTPRGKELLQLYNSIRLDVAYADMQGDSTKNNAAARVGFIREWDGMDKIIKTGYTDEVSSAAAAAVDSYVATYGATLSGTIVQTISDAHRSRKEVAEMVGKPNVVWGIRVPTRMRYQLIDFWACNYQTARCDTSINTSARYSLETVTRLRDEMLRGNYLLIDGEQVPLVGDWAMPNAVGATTNEWVGDIFGVALFDPMGTGGMLADGGEWLTWREYAPMSAEGTAQLAQDGFNDFVISNGGLYLWGSKVTNMCKNYQGAALMRINSPYPFLHWRVDDITYNYTLNTGSPYVADPDYLGGGDDAR